MAWAKTTIQLPSDYSKDDALTVAEEILHYIVERTKEGKGKDGKSFPGYSSSYKKSFDFKVAGKGEKVNLTLSGEMLDSLEVISASRGKVVIGLPKDSTANGRAEGNILGSYGGEPNKKKARDFLALSNKELSHILSELDILPRDIQNEIVAAAKSGAYDIVDNISFGEDDG
jgi:hypothetical protein